MANSLVGYIALLRQLASFCKGWVIARSPNTLPQSLNMYYGIHGLDRVGWAHPTYMYIYIYIKFIQFTRCSIWPPPNKISGYANEDFSHLRNGGAVIRARGVVCIGVGIRSRTRTNSIGQKICKSAVGPLFCNLGISWCKFNQVIWIYFVDTTNTNYQWAICSFYNRNSSHVVVILI